MRSRNRTDPYQTRYWRIAVADAGKSHVYSGDHVSRERKRPSSLMYRVKGDCNIKVIPPWRGGATVSYGVCASHRCRIQLT